MAERGDRDRLGRKRRKIQERLSPYTKYDDQEFQARFRLTKPVVKRLEKDYSKGSRYKGSTRGGGLTHLDRLCLVLRYFATGSFYYMTADSQRVSRTNVCRSVKDVSDFFYRNIDKYVHWPSSFLQKMQGALKFYRHEQKRSGEQPPQEQRTPFVFGLVDGTHIPLQTPPQNESAFVCRKGYHSINTTIVCDYDKRIIHVDPRWPGSVNDAYALHASPVGDEIEDETWGDYMLLGDGGYGLKRNLFTPFRTAAPNSKEESYNKWHRKNRVRVEQTIGILKQRWRILDSSAGYLRHKPARAARIIGTCCCLHNIAMDHGVRIVDHPSDPWVPARAPLRQPRQRNRENEEGSEAERIRGFRQAYVQRHFCCHGIKSLCDRCN